MYTSLILPVHYSIFVVSGNAGFETADRIVSNTAYIHMAGRFDLFYVHA